MSQMCDQHMEKVKYRYRPIQWRSIYYLIFVILWTKYPPEHFVFRCFQSLYFPQIKRQNLNSAYSFSFNNEILIK